MKKDYLHPELNVVLFENNVDVLTVSGCDNWADFNDGKDWLEWSDEI